MTRIDVFNRRENRNFDSKWLNESSAAACFTFDAEVDAPMGTFEALEQIIATAHSLGVAKGSRRSGIFEVQTDEGIWRHTNERRIDTSTERTRRNVEWATWDELEAMEN